MKKIVLDSCVFIKIFIDENERQSAISLISKIIEEKIKVIIPELFYYEVLTILSKNNLLDDKSLNLIEYCNQTFLNSVSIKDNSALIKISSNITNQGNNKSGYPSFYDSVYHGLAIMSECDFITSDQKHYEKVKNLGNIKLLKDVIKS